MKCSNCKNFKVQEVITKKDNKEYVYGTCSINNSVCDPGDECKTGLFDKTGAI